MRTTQGNGEDGGGSVVPPIEVARAGGILDHVDADGATLFDPRQRLAEAQYVRFVCGAAG